MEPGLSWIAITTSRVLVVEQRNPLTARAMTESLEKVRVTLERRDERPHKSAEFDPASKRSTSVAPTCL